jgi:hypothetical protein
MLFDKPGFQAALATWACREVYRRIRDELGATA